MEEWFKPQPKSIFLVKGITIIGVGEIDENTAGLIAARAISIAIARDTVAMEVSVGEQGPFHVLLLRDDEEAAKQVDYRPQTIQETLQQHPRLIVTIFDDAHQQKFEHPVMISLLADRFYKRRNRGL